MKHLFKRTIAIIAIISTLSSVCSLSKRTYDFSDRISYKASVWLFADDENRRDQKKD